MQTQSLAEQILTDTGDLLIRVSDGNDESKKRLDRVLELLDQIKEHSLTQPYANRKLLSRCAETETRISGDILATVDAMHLRITTAVDSADSRTGT